MNLRNSMQTIPPLTLNCQGTNCGKRKKEKTEVELTSNQINLKSRDEANSVALITAINFVATELGLFKLEQKAPKNCLLKSRNTPS